MAKLSKEEKRWQAEEDARTMARYQEIRSDKKRRSNAVNQAMSEAASLQKRADAMRKAAKVKY